MTEDKALDLWKQYGLGKTYWTFEFARAVEEATLERVISILETYGLGKDHVVKEIRDIASALPAQDNRDPIRALIAQHAEQLEQNDYAYFELAYTRITGWMAWICSNNRDDDPNRKVLAKGQGDSPEAACEAALAALPAAQPGEKS